MKKIIVSKNEDGIRLTKYLKKVFDKMPDSIMHKLLRKKYFEVNDKKADGSEVLTSGDSINIYLSDDTYKKFETNGKYVLKKDTDIQYNKDTAKKSIVYEDDNIIIFNKPAGLLSQGNTKNSISVNSILNDYIGENNNDALFEPSAINRLDRNTKGLIIFAKTYIAARCITDMIKNKKIEKHYVALVNGIVENNNQHLTHILKKDTVKNKVIIKDYISDDLIESGYSKVELEYKILKKYKDKTLLDINLITGKSHQIRAQLSYIGYPIVNDNKYNIRKDKFTNSHQILICYKIKFGMFDNDELKYLNNKIFEIEVKHNEFQ